MRHTAQSLSLLLLLAATAACGWRAAHDPSMPPAPRTTVQIWNQALVDMNVYVQTESGQRMRLGMVPGSGSRTFVIPQGMVIDKTRLRFQADPIGADALSTSEDLMVHPGDQLSLTLRR
jgi:hypothetical protein